MMGLKTLFGLFSYSRHGIAESFGGYYYVVHALGASLNLEKLVENGREHKYGEEAEEPYWLANLLCAAT